MSLLDAGRKYVVSIAEDGETTVQGLAFYIHGDEVWITDIPRMRPGAKAKDRLSESVRNYCKKARFISLSELEKSLESEAFPRIRLIPETQPPHWQLIDEQLMGHMRLPLGMVYTPKQLTMWKKKRDDNYELIAPIVAGKSLQELLYDASLADRVQTRAAELGKSRATIWGNVNRYIAAGAAIRGLMPHYHKCGAPNKPKFPSIPSGRKSKAEEDGFGDHRGFLCEKGDRLNCVHGWNIFKKPDVSIEAAYTQFLQKFYISSMICLPNGDVEVKLLPRHLCPSIHQFQYYGQGGDPMRGPNFMGISAHNKKNNVAGYRGTAIQGITNVLQLGTIDWTSDDQVLCSQSSTLLMLSSTGTTRIIDQRSGYCLGEYTSFEKPSALTHIRAVEHAATEKREWAARYGVDLEEGEWHHGVFARIRSDNGEGKSDEAKVALTGAHIDLEFTAAWHARAKNICEASHLLQHRILDWNMPGSTKGKILKRGEPPQNFVPVNFQQYMQLRIKAVCHYNNEEAVPQLLTVAMRKEDVEPTRRGIFEYLIKTGQVSSGPYDVLSLRPHVLPRLNGVVGIDGIRLWDPRYESGRRYIPDLVYWADWLYSEGYLERAGAKKIHVTVSLDPTYIGRAYVQVNSKHQWREIKIPTSDPDKCELTLMDWLAITDHDNMRAWIQRHISRQSQASIHASIKAAEDKQAAKRAAELQAGEKTSAVSRARKRENTRKELDAQTAANLGLSKENQPELLPVASAPQEEGAESASLELGGTTDPEMDQIRAIREARRNR